MNGMELDSKRVMDLYKQGFTDKEIAIRLGRADNSICGWRLRRGLPPNKKRPHLRYITPAEQDAVEAKRLGYPSYGYFKAAQYEAEQAKKRRKKS